MNILWSITLSTSKQMRTIIFHSLLWMDYLKLRHGHYIGDLLFSLFSYYVLCDSLFKINRCLSKNWFNLRCHNSQTVIKYLTSFFPNQSIDWFTIANNICKDFFVCTITYKTVEQFHKRPREVIRYHSYMHSYELVLGSNLENNITITQFGHKTNFDHKVFKTKSLSNASNGFKYKHETL